MRTRCIRHSKCQVRADPASCMAPPQLALAARLLPAPIKFGRSGCKCRIGAWAVLVDARQSLGTLRARSPTRPGGLAPRADSASSPIFRQLHSAVAKCFHAGSRALVARTPPSFGSAPIHARSLSDFAKRQALQAVGSAFAQSLPRFRFRPYPATSGRSRRSDSVSPYWVPRCATPTQTSVRPTGRLLTPPGCLLTPNPLPPNSRRLPRSSDVLQSQPL